MPSLDKLPSLKSVVDGAGLSADKRLGQHFLLDPAILARIVKAAEIRPGDTVLEIGPGPGGLTRALLAAGAQVVAIERDRRCFEALAPLVEWSKGAFRIVHGDALAIQPQEEVDHRAFKIVANLPYNVGTEMLVRWLQRPDGISNIHVLLQKEVVDRVVASPGTKIYGRLSILAQLTSKVTRHFDLPAGAFHPPPKVVSSLVGLSPKSDAPKSEILKALQDITQAAFGQRRKMLKSSLKSLSVPIKDLLGSSDIRPEQRPEALPPEAFLYLAERLVDYRR